MIDAAVMMPRLPGHRVYAAPHVRAQSSGDRQRCPLAWRQDVREVAQRREKRGEDRNCPRFSAAPADDAPKLFGSLAWLVVAARQCPPDLALIRRQGLAHGCDEHNPPGVPTFARQNASEEVAILQGAAHRDERRHRDSPPAPSARCFATISASVGPSFGLSSSRRSRPSAWRSVRMLFNQPRA